ncbi:MAG: 4Fe-4S binding protein [Verrucomicrobiales bacterium]|nr:4Fe-4S binding protein [Verrucomicrobiales bacterium]
MAEKQNYKWVPVITDYCIGCGKCVDACPHQCIKPIWDFATLVTPETCTSGGACGEVGDCIPVCEDDAIHMGWEKVEGGAETGKWTDHPPKPVRKGLWAVIKGLFGESSMLPEYKSTTEGREEQ